MTNFFDLPKPVREKMYRLHLVREEVITWADHLELSHKEQAYRRYACDLKEEPSIFSVSAKADREAAPIYFGENTFKLEIDDEVYRLSMKIWPRHLKFIRNLILSWVPKTGWQMNERFKVVARLANLDMLQVEVDEQQWLDQRILELRRSGELRWHDSLGFSIQIQHKALFMPGMNGLRSLRGIRKISFPLSIPGGIFNTVVRREVTGPKKGRRLYLRKGKFRFFDLPNELRNQIYSELLVLPGIMYPSDHPPSSVAAVARYQAEDEREEILAAAPCSALDLLAVNKQMYDEAVAIFYWDNDFAFSWPSELQGFLASIGPTRLSFVRNITLFHKDHREGLRHTSQVTMQMLRLLPNLRRFHLLVKGDMLRYKYRFGRIVYEGSPAQIQGIKVLFSLRKIEDIRVRDVELEREATRPAQQYRRDIAAAAKSQTLVLRHFNHGLTLAQKGMVNQELFKDKDWHRYEDQELWPELDGSTCSTATGCGCPEGMAYGVQEKVDETKEAGK